MKTVESFNGTFHTIKQAKEQTMNAFKKCTAALAMILMTGNFVHAKGIDFQDLTLSEGLEKARLENKKVFIDIYATWCGPCKYMTNNVFPDEDLGAFMNEHFISLKLDGEYGDGEQLMIEFNLDAYPTMLFLDPDKTVLNKIVGGVDVDELKAVGNEVLFPETSLIFQLDKKYAEGGRDREFLSQYAIELLNRDREFQGVMDEFIALYPTIDLFDENEFIVFCAGVHERSNVNSQVFLKNMTELYDLHGDFVITKLNMIFEGIVTDAIDIENKSLIESETEAIYEDYQLFYAEDAVTLDELVEMMNEMYDEGTL
jgi:thiol-disulfide isomerase/thioredoxin